jgi:hypothetical protein
MLNPRKKSARHIIDALIRSARPTDNNLKRRLREFDEHYHNNPLVEPYLTKHCRHQAKMKGWICFDAAWADCLRNLKTPGGKDHKLPAQLKSLYVRAIIAAHPELDSFFEVHFCNADRILGSKIAAKKLPGEYGRRVVWPDDKKPSVGTRQGQLKLDWSEVCPCGDPVRLCERGHYPSGIPSIFA